ncbi:hypothetical protein FOL47_004589 [Perkinsus chesapeaki]|uniref:Uncharacterized protein n=1 Tax=Perkinsus chesapeaki TaxID=330153 RepID=A0A7J6MZJ5_PERCH|nr:hypothetical protein FOL47_004589 [Perkinsus chesapeaki]
MTSFALSKTCKEGANEELKDILLSAEPGDFVPSIVHQAFADACTSKLNPTVVRILVDDGGLLVRGVPDYMNLVHEICASTTPSNFSNSKHVLQTLVIGCHIDINSYCTSQDSDMCGLSPLGIAVKKRNPPLAFELLALGARPNIGHCSGATPLKILSTMEHDKNDDEVILILTNLLRSKGGVVEGELIKTDDRNYGQDDISGKVNKGREGPTVGLSRCRRDDRLLYVTASVELLPGKTQDPLPFENPSTR